MNSIYFLSLLSLLATSMAKINATEIRRTNQYNFSLSEEVVTKKNILYFWEVLDEKHVPLKFDQKYNGSTQALSWHVLKNLDFSGQRTTNQSPGSYAVGLSKTAYLLNKPVSFFTENQLCSMSYLKKIITELTVTQKDKCIFHLSGEPEMDFKLTVYDEAPELQNISPSVSVFKSEWSMAPSVITVQENFNFGKVMGMKTGHLSYTLTFYYPWKENESMVVIYGLSYMHNLPPRIPLINPDGPEVLRKEYESSAKSGVTQIRNF